MKNLIEILDLAEKSAANTAALLEEAAGMMPEHETLKRLEESFKKNKEMSGAILGQRVELLRTLVRVAYYIPDKEYRHSRDIMAGLCDYQITSPGTIRVDTSPDLVVRMKHLTGTYNCTDFMIKASKECLYWQDFCLAMTRRIKDTLEYGPDRLRKLIEGNLQVASVVKELVEQHS